jgi:predicted DNA binding CopG/RHH family protein
MKKSIRETDAPRHLAKSIETGEFVPDFLPPPSELVAKEDTVKVTISLSRSSVDFFKREARVSHVPYQAMVREVVDIYARRWSK